MPSNGESITLHINGMLFAHPNAPFGLSVCSFASKATSRGVMAACWSLFQALGQILVPSSTHCHTAYLRLLLFSINHTLNQMYRAFRQLPRPMPSTSVSRFASIAMRVVDCIYACTGIQQPCHSEHNTSLQHVLYFLCCISKYLVWYTQLDID